MSWWFSTTQLENSILSQGSTSSYLKVNLRWPIKHHGDSSPLQIPSWGPKHWQFRRVLSAVRRRQPVTNSCHLSVDPAIFIQFEKENLLRTKIKRLEACASICLRARLLSHYEDPPAKEHVLSYKHHRSLPATLSFSSPRKLSKYPNQIKIHIRSLDPNKLLDRRTVV